MNLCFFLGVPDLTKVAMNSLSAANTHFTFDLFQQFKTSKKDDNIFCSPLSISSALAMTYLGAKENTAFEMEMVGVQCSEPTFLYLKVEKLGNVHHQFQKLLTELKKPTDANELNIANKLYGEKNYQFLQVSFIWPKFYLTSVESVDFKNAPEESRKKINSWVESQTHEKIKDLLPKNSLEFTTVLVLVNAIYFKGQWDNKFDKRNTVEKEFWLNKDTSKPVQMMKQVNVFKFTSLEDIKAKILEIPYKGKDLSMVLLLPDDVDGLQKVKSYQLTAEKLREWTSSQNMHDNYVDLYLPRFKVEETYDLKDTLRALGMVDVFNPQRANLSGMTGTKDLLVSKVIHKSFVEVTEEGTEAASSTAVVVNVGSPPTHPFHCDHPFLFFIRHNKTNSILFLGRVSSP
uniref:Serpin domain-containing protein n=1 Tax=Neovison vison TaxID=452646 RepID=A0A8C7B059_NEOVI